MSPTVLITGCSSGIGETTARLFLANDWKVYATARDADDVAHLEALGAETERLDATAEGAAERAVERVVAEAGAVDCVVNNAAYGQFGPVEDVPSGAVREQYATNVFGPLELVRAAVPYMRRRGGGTVINVTSFGVRTPVAGVGVYGGTKAALAHVTGALRQEVADHDVDVVQVEPPVVATPFYDRMLAELEDLPRSPAYDDLYETLERMAAVREGGFGVADPERVAVTIVRAAESDDPKARYGVGWLPAATRLVSALPEGWQHRLVGASVRTMASGPGRRVLNWWADRGPREDDGGPTGRRRERDPGRPGDASRETGYPAGRTGSRRRAEASGPGPS